MNKRNFKTIAVNLAIALSVLCGSTALADDYLHNPHPSGAFGLQAPGLSQYHFNAMHTPAIVDTAALYTEIRTLELEISAVERAAVAVRDNRLRGILLVQVNRMKSRTQRLRGKLNRARSVVGQPAVAVVAAPIGYNHIRPVSPTNFESMRRTLRDTPFSDARLQALRHLAHRNHFTTKQSRQVAKLFPFANERLDALTIMYPSVVNPEQYHQVLDLLPFSSYRQKLMKRIDSLDHL
jgi:hypothetical protein